MSILDKTLFSPWLAAAVALAALVIGVPLFLRMPPWCDLTLYDVAARTVIGGGTMYRDVFDTNLPGFVWCLIGIRRVGGNSVEVVRAVDLVIVAAIVALLMRFLRRGGASPAAAAWLAAAVALYYPFTTEFSHAQRDVWMTLPMLVALSLRVRNIERGQQLDRRALFRASVLEGAVWAVAVWFKPHVLLVAGVMWLVTLPARRRATPGTWRLDLGGNFVGGSIVALLGILALVITGTWKPLMDVLFKWNTSYLEAVWSETGNMFSRFLDMFPPWSLLHLLAVPLAIFAIARMYCCTHDSARFRSGVLAAFYLVILAQACGLQRNFDYVHVPETILMLALVAMMLPRLLALGILGMLVITFVWPESFEHRVAKRWHQWSRCFASLPPKEHRQRQHRLAVSGEYCSTINPVEIGEVADWLRAKGVESGDVLAWHDSPHAVYLELGIAPRFRFMHISTALISEQNLWRAMGELRKALPRSKYVVSDVLHPIRHEITDYWQAVHMAGSDRLPPCFTPRLRQSFPFDQPAVFRSGGERGRYVIHRVTTPEVKHFEFEWDVLAK